MRIFLSHSNVDRPIASRFAYRLKSEGHELVGQFDNLMAGQLWEQVIGEQLDKSDVVVVLWSTRSVESQWVLDEASRGRAQGKLLPILIDDVRPPLGFTSLNHLDLSAWDGDPQDPGWRTVQVALEGIAKRRDLSRADSDTNAQRAGKPRSATRVFEPIKAASKLSVFVAHSSTDKPRLGGIVEALVAAGFSLWIDKPHQIPCSEATRTRISRIHMGDDWKESIATAVSRADKVMAFWSDDAIDAKREQFQYEVYQGLIQRKLFQCKLDPMAQDKIGMPYTFHQIADLSDFETGEYHYELDYLMNDIARTSGSKWRRWLPF